MDDLYGDMPGLVDPQRFDGGAVPMNIGRNPFPGAPDPWYNPGAQPHSFTAPGAYPGIGPSSWGGYDSPSSQGTTMSMSWASSAMSTPMLGAPVPAAIAMMPASFPVSSEGWPRPLAGRGSADNTPPWKDRDVDDAAQSDRRFLPAPRAHTPLSRSISLSSSPSSTSLSAGSLSRNTSLRGNAAEAQKRPPREWRADFSLSGTSILSGLLGTRGRSKSFGGGGGALIRFDHSAPHSLNWSTWAITSRKPEGRVAPVYPVHSI